MGEWRKDAIPMDGTPVCVRAVCTYRYQPYKPNSEQRKRGIKGRWQVLNEYGGWSNCAAPINDGWMLAEDWSPEVESADGDKYAGVQCTNCEVEVSRAAIEALLKRIGG